MDHSSDIELRIHGIGAHTARYIIGHSDRVQSTRSLHQATERPNLYAVVWSSLTRRGLRAFSFLLLPFSLLNAAKFMVPGDAGIVFSIANVFTSASWILWGILIFHDLPQLTDSTPLRISLYGAGATLAALVASRIISDIVSWNRSSRRPPGDMFTGTSRTWLAHYSMVAFLVYLFIVIGSGGNALLGLSYFQIGLLGFGGGIVRLMHVGQPHVLLATDVAFIACALSHLWGYALTQAVAMSLTGEWRQIEFAYPTGIVSGVKAPGVDGTFFLWSAALAAWVLVLSIRVACRALWRFTRRPQEPPEAAELYQSPRWVRRKYRRLLKVASRAPLKSATLWFPAFLVGSQWYWDAISYWSGVGDTPPLIWTLPWRQFAIGAGIASVLVISWLSLRSASGGSLLASAFDVLGYLPRQHHPWAPASYADLAIRDIHEAIRYLTRPGRRLWVVGHSQGSVLAFTALSTLDEEIVRQCRLITVGSPLARLYGYFFPAMFTAERFTTLGRRISGGENSTVWWNFHRRTDPISGPIASQSGTIRDVPLMEPAVVVNLPLVTVLGHSGYWTDPQVVSLTHGVTDADPLPRQGGTL